MNIIFEKNDERYRIKIVDLIEEADDLFKLIDSDLNENEINKYHSIKNSNRKKEWLAVRVLLKKMIGRYSQIKYDPTGNPYTDEGFNISITHSKNIIGIIIGEDDNLGIDTEIISDRILRTAHKFIKKEELDQFSDTKKLKKIWLNWCGKETLYKIKDRDSIDFKNNFNISINELDTSGIIIGTFKNHSVCEEYKISYAFFDLTGREVLVTWHSSQSEKTD